MNEIDNTGGKKEEQSNNWFRSFLSSSSSSSSPEQFTLTLEEKQEIEKAIDYLETTQKLNVNESTLNLILRANLRKATVTLCLDDEGKDEVRRKQTKKERK